MIYQLYSLRKLNRVGTSNVRKMLVKSEYNDSWVYMGYYTPVQTRYTQYVLGWESDNTPDIVHIDNTNTPYIVDNGKRIYPLIFASAKKLEE